MSTIEKAAERLAARKGREGPKSRPEEVVQQTTSAALSRPSAAVVAPRPAMASNGSSQDSEMLGKLRGWLPEVPRESVKFEFEALSAAGFLTPDQARSVLAQEFRKIKRQILNRIDRLLRTSETIEKESTSSR